MSNTLLQKPGLSSTFFHLFESSGIKDVLNDFKAKRDAKANTHNYNAFLDRFKPSPNDSMLHASMDSPQATFAPKTWRTECWTNPQTPGKRLDYALYLTPDTLTVKAIGPRKRFGAAPEYTQFQIGIDTPEMAKFLAVIRERGDDLLLGQFAGVSEFMSAEEVKYNQNVELAFSDRGLSNKDIPLIVQYLTALPQNHYNDIASEYDARGGESYGIESMLGAWGDKKYIRDEVNKQLPPGWPKETSAFFIKDAFENVKQIQQVDKVKAQEQKAIVDMAFSKFGITPADAPLIIEYLKTLPVGYYEDQSDEAKKGVNSSEKEKQYKPYFNGDYAIVRDEINKALPDGMREEVSGLFIGAAAHYVQQHRAPSITPLDASFAKFGMTPADMPLIIDYLKTLPSGHYEDWIDEDKKSFETQQTEKKYKPYFEGDYAVVRDAVNNAMPDGLRYETSGLFIGAAAHYVQQHRTMTTPDDTLSL